MLAQLIPREGGPPITLQRAITVVGRSPRFCDLVIQHTNVSKQHCLLVKTDGLIYVRDLGSTNGTRVNGQRIIRGALLPGDVLSLSGTSYRIHLGPDKPGTGPGMLNGVTEMIPVVSDMEFSQGYSSDTFRSDEASKSDVRFLRDSDLLPPI